MEMLTEPKLKTILIVDDVFANRLLLSEIIKIEKIYNIIESENGKDAIEKLNNNKIDLIFMDIMMPIMNGVESMKHIRTVMNSNIPIIALTAYDIQDGSIVCDENNFNNILPKPYRIYNILTLIKKYL